MGKWSIHKYVSAETVCCVCVCVHGQTCWETHYAEYSVQLVMVEGITGLYIFLPTVKDGLRC